MYWLLSHVEIKQRVQSSGESGHGGDTPKSSALPLCRVLEVPYAYQCCAYGSCSSFFKISNQWEAEDMGPEEEDPHKRTVELFPGHADNHCK